MALKRMAIPLIKDELIHYIPKGPGLSTEWRAFPGGFLRGLPGDFFPGNGEENLANGQGGCYTEQ